MRHREFVLWEDEELKLTDHAPRYAVGSGSHSFTYLIQDGDFLIESPVTWFTPKEKWDLSPGYEKTPFQPGFSRPINTTCVNCHSGGAEAIDNGLYRFEIREHAIGCERCHGPGSLHVAKQESGDASGTGPDFTIVNPARLHRGRVESICQQCHLEGAMRVRVRGREATDFRPGLRFEDFEMAYVLTSGDASMKVVGHVEQMRQSRCYTESNSMTCVTCHNPHDTPLPKERVAYFRDKCLECHKVDTCGIPEEQRRKTDQQDNCSWCHMPQSPVDVPHVSFTHHRIGIHADAPTGEDEAHPLQDLTPLLDDSHLSQIDKDRCRGLAYLELSGVESDQMLAQSYGRRARQLLEGVKRQGLNDPDTDSALARMRFSDGDFEGAAELAAAVLTANDLSPSVRIDALDTLASVYYETNQFSKAVMPLELLISLRRDAEDWRRLALCRYGAENKAAALDAIEEAARIAPHRAELQSDLADLLRQMEEPTAAAAHLKRAEALRSKVRAVQ